MNRHEKQFGLPEIIKSIRDAMTSENVIAALAVALTIPDKCGQIAYPNEKSCKMRYTRWLQDTQFYGIPESKENAERDAEMVYYLRCSILHSHSSDAYEGKTCNDFLRKIELRDTGINKTGIFTSFEICTSRTKIRRDEKPISLEEKTLIVYVYDFCEVVCQCAEKFYKDNKDKFREKSNITIANYTFDN